MEDAANEVKDLRGLRDVNQAEQITGLSHWWLRKLVKRGSLACVRVGPNRRLMFPAAELLRLLKESK